MVIHSRSFMCRCLIRLSTLLALILLPIVLVAQEDVISVINELVQSGEYEQAMQQADEYLKEISPGC